MEKEEDKEKRRRRLEREELKEVPMNERSAGRVGEREAGLRYKVRGRR